MPLEKVNQYTVTQVGKYYLVLHIIYDDQCIPIIGKAHRDPQLGVKVKHYHVDTRFKNPFMIDYFINGKFVSGTNSVVALDKSEYTFKWIKRKCLRPYAGIIGVRRKEMGPKLKSFLATYMGKSCKGRKCPHYGHHMHEQDGKLVCPLHGLKGDIQKEIIIDGPFFD